MNKHSEKLYRPSDLVRYMNGTGYFKTPVVLSDVFRVFQKAHLIDWSDERKQYEPTKWLEKCDGVHITKNGFMLFKENLWNMMTQDTKWYTALEWLEWFVWAFNTDEQLPEPGEFESPVETEHKQDEQPITVAEVCKKVFLVSITTGVRKKQNILLRIVAENVAEIKKRVMKSRNVRINKILAFNSKMEVGQ